MLKKLVLCFQRGKKSSGPTTDPSPSVSANSLPAHTVWKHSTPVLLLQLSINRYQRYLLLPGAKVTCQIQTVPVLVKRYQRCLLLQATFVKTTLFHCDFAISTPNALFGFLSYGLPDAAASLPGRPSTTFCHLQADLRLSNCRLSQILS
jgi:hypothetical protein